MFAPMLLLWPLSVVITFLLARSLADVPFDRALIERTEALARQATVASDTGALSLPGSVSDFVAAGEDNTQVYLQVIAPRGRLMVGQPDLPPPRLYDYPEPGRVKLRTATYRGNDVRIGYLYLDDGQADDGAPMLVQVAETLDRRTRLANEIIKGVIFPQFMILPVAVTLVWFGLSRGLKPLKALQGRIRSRAPNDLSPIDPRGAPEEIAPLVDAFNDQIERLGRNIDSQKRFVASAAHQMKTPLAGLRTQAELAMREKDPEQLRQRLEQIADRPHERCRGVGEAWKNERREDREDEDDDEDLDQREGRARGAHGHGAPSRRACRVTGRRVHRSGSSATAGAMMTAASVSSTRNRARAEPVVPTTGVNSISATPSASTWRESRPRSRSASKVLMSEPYWPRR
jgi:two-component system sensor histidine kinase TctE